MKFFTPSLLSVIIASISLNQLASAPLGSDDIKSTSVSSANPDLITMDQAPIKSTNSNNRLVKNESNAPLVGEKPKSRRADIPEKPKADMTVAGEKPKARRADIPEKPKADMPVAGEKPKARRADVPEKPKADMPVAGEKPKARRADMPEKPKSINAQELNV